MNHYALAAALAATLAFTVAEARADVVISNESTQDMSCSAGVCTPTAAAAVLNSSDLAALLARGHVTVTTTGNGVQASNIDITGALSWSTKNILTLDAYQSLTISNSVSVVGRAGLTLITNDGGTNGLLTFAGGGNVTFSRLSSKLTINGQLYKLVGTVRRLAREIAENPNNDFALASSYDAQNDGTYARAPIRTQFGGALEGLGNTISNLTVSDQFSGDSVGLFASLYGSTVTDLNLSNISVSGNGNWIGGVVGTNNGLIQNVSIQGTLQGNASNSVVGGIAGQNTGTIASVTATVVATDNGNNTTVGGIVGLNGNTGGSGGSILQALATGSVSGSANAGGVVGFNVYSVTNSASSASVSGAYGGGVVGNNIGLIQLSSASGSVSSNNLGGGVAGKNDYPGEIDLSYSTGSVSVSSTDDSNSSAGGFVGQNGDGGGSVALIVDCYSLGSVSLSGSGGNVGGFAGFNGSNATIQAAYSTGFVSGDGSDYMGGFVGQAFGGMSYTYWDTDTSGVTDLSDGSGSSANLPGIQGLTTAELQAGLPLGFSSSTWNESPPINDGLPYLIQLEPRAKRAATSGPPRK